MIGIEKMVVTPEQAKQAREAHIDKIIIALEEDIDFWLCDWYSDVRNTKSIENSFYDIADIDKQRIINNLIDRYRIAGWNMEYDGTNVKLTPLQEKK